MMNNEILKKLINENNESEIVEFKTSLNDVNQICKYISALGNSAIIASCPCAYLIWGVEDLTKKVIGTKFDPYTSKARIDPKNTRKKVNSNVPFITYVEQYIDPKIELKWFSTEIQHQIIKRIYIL